MVFDLICIFVKAHLLENTVSCLDARINIRTFRNYLFWLYFVL